MSLRQPRLWIGYLALVGLLAVGYYALPGGHLLRWTPIGASAVVATAVGIRVNRPSRPAAWYLLATAVLLFITGDVVYDVLTEFLHQVNPFPSLADVSYLAMYPVLVAGLLLLIRARVATKDWASLVDALTITVGLGLPLWVYLILPDFRAPGLTDLARLTSVAYPLGDVVLLSMLVRLVGGGGLRIPAVRLLVVGAVGMLASDVAYGLDQLHGSWSVGSVIDIGWIVFYGAWGAAALHPSMRYVGDVAVKDTTGTLHRGRILLLAAFGLIGPAVLLSKSLGGDATEAGTVAVFSGVLYLLVVSRLAGIVTNLRQQQNDAHFKGLIQNASDIILVVGVDGMVTYCSPSLERILGWPARDIEHRLLRSIVHHEDVATVDELLSSAAGVNAPKVADWRLRHAGGLLRSFEVVANNMVEDPNVQGVVLTMRDVSERRALEERLKYQAFHDGLTGLANRALFHDRAARALGNLGRTRASVAMVTLDLDDFKVVNDTYGHSIGDVLLQAVADRITAELRPGDTPARLGGDEFAVLLEDVIDPAGAEQVVVRLLEVLNSPFFIEGEKLYAHTSAGLVLADSAAESITVSEMLRRADLAMYAAKERGKNGFVTYHADLHSKVVERVVLKTQLQNALEAEEFLLYYQPIVELDTGQIIGAEALLRWQRPGHPVLLPWDFIDLAEESGLIVPIGRWVLDQACAQVRSWSDEFGRPLLVSVNISAVQLNAGGFVDDVREALSRHHLPPASLFLELTESLLVDDGSSTPQLLHELRDMSITLAIDDFGTGYSSLGYLRRFPIDILKIDKLFVDGLGTGNDDDSTLARAIVSLAQALRLEIIAEGIESVDQRDELVALGCRLGQGYLYSKPVGPSDIRAMLAGSGRLEPDVASSELVGPATAKTLR